MTTTFNRLKDLVLAQGIVCRIEVLPETNLIQDLHYRPSDVAELIRLVELEFGLTIPEEDSEGVIQLNQLTSYIYQQRLAQ